MVLVLSWGALSCGPAPAPIGDWPMFAPDWIVEVEIEIDQADWDALRVQRRDWMDVLCADSPPPRPFVYYPARVTIDGHRVAKVGVRKKCFFGSCDETRPALKLSFNEYVRGRRFYGMRRMTLNNNLSDPSTIKQCLGYWLFRRAGVVAPRCNFAHLVVNGVDKGIYSHVESIKTELLARYFADPGGNLYEGALSDFQPDWVGTYQKKTNQENPDRSDLDAMVDALQVPDHRLVAALEPLMDLDAFYTFWAMEVSMNHVDGYCGRNHNNTYIYNDPATGRFHFIPWGIDGILWDRGGPPENPVPRSVLADAILPHRLYRIPETRAIYLDRLLSLLDAVWDQDRVLAEIDRMENLVAGYSAPNGNGDIAPHVEAVRQFVRTYPGYIRAELEAGPPAWEMELPGPPCLSPRGSAEVGFATSWDSLDGHNAGTGQMTIVIHQEDQPPGEPLDTAPGLAVAGRDRNQPDRPVVVGVIADVVGQPNPTRILVAVYLYDESLIGDGNSVPLDMDSAVGMVFYDDLANDANDVQFLLLNGELEFDQAAMTPGAAVSGTIHGEIRESGW